MRIIPDPKDWAWTFGGYAPLASITPGEVVEVFTEDCFGGLLRSAHDLPSTSLNGPGLNPQTGPFHVRGADVGDTLAVHLVDVQPARDWGVSATVALFGALTSTVYTATLQEPLPERTWIYRVVDGGRNVEYRAQDSDFTARIPTHPFHGTIGVAPAEREARSTLVPDYFGGNMDTREARAGTTVYLGVNVPGALVSLGDGHYAMGDGESCGVAVEGAMNTSFVVDVIKGEHVRWPRLEDDEFIMVAGSCRPLEDAFRIAHTELVRWTAEETGLSLMDAYQLVSQASRSSIANVCDRNYTVIAKLAKSYLPRPEQVMHGIHANLKATAAARRPSPS